jgi:hypothetical protein
MKGEKFDFLSFLEGTKKNSIEIIGTEYANPGEPLDVGIMGESFHVILFRDHEEDPEQYSDAEHFDAVLVDPLEYISGLIPQGWYGIIARKTTTSKPLLDRLLANLAKKE